MMFFFFQAEDGIRDIGVTGVQTCALPIWCRSRGGSPGRTAGPRSRRRSPAVAQPGGPAPGSPPPARPDPTVVERLDRESVVSGKRVDLGGRRILKKKQI